MPAPEFDLKRVKLKTSPELSPAERNFLIEHKADLNDEDKAAYADWLPEEISGINFSEVGNPELKTAVSDDEGGEEEGGEDTEDEGKEEAKETPPPAQYATREDMVGAIDKAFEKLVPFLSKAEVKEKKEEVRKLFEDDKKYTLAQAADLIKAETKREIKEEIDRENKEKMDAANADVAKWVQQYNELVVSEKLPALNTKEGQDMWKKLDEIGGKEGLSTFKQAYRFYSLLPEGQGGGKAELTDEQKAEASKKETDKAKLNAQKKAAGKVSGGRGSEDKGKSVKKYGDIHVPLDQYLQTH